MGCSASKLENEDTVRRCKERRRLIKEAVNARHNLASAHSDYIRSLRLTGSSLVNFSNGEPLLSVSHHTPAVLLRTTPTVKSSYVPSPSVHPRRPGKGVKVPHILSDSSFTSSPPPPENIRRNDFNTTTTYKGFPRSSNYSATPSQASSVWNWDNFYPPPSPPSSEYFEEKNNNFKKKTHQNDVVLGDSDFDDQDNPFGRMKQQGSKQFDDDRSSSNYSASYSNKKQHCSNRAGLDKRFDDDRASSYSTSTTTTTTYSKKKQQQQGMQNPPKQQRYESEYEGHEEEEEETEREEVQCSEWGDHDHYTSTSSSASSGENDDNEDDDLESRSDFGRPTTRSNFGSVNSETTATTTTTTTNTMPGHNWNHHQHHKFTSKLEKLESEEGKSEWGDTNTMNTTTENMDRRIVVRHKDLGEIVAAINEYFDKAAAAGDQVSEMLETGRAQLDRSFKQLRKTVYHSSGVLSSLSSSWTSKPPLAVKYRFEPSSIDQSGGSKSLCSTLERLLAWEKKLYQEVKAREGVKIEHEKKLSQLQSQEYRGEEDGKLDKTKASITRLQSLISVTSQAVSTTSSAIVGTRDSNLVPQLVELCHGFMYMWRSMNQFHEIQNNIVQQVRGLVNDSNKGESTSDLHRQATRDLEAAVSSWHSSFCRLIKFQREFVQSLHGWFKLTMLPVHNEPNNNTNRELSEVFAFCDEWKLALDRIPDTVASEAIKSFINVVHSISLKQAEEVKVKKRTETVSKELEKKASSLRSIEKKYYHSYSMVGIGVPDNGTENGAILDARDPLSEKKAELATCQRRVEDEMVKHAKAVEVTRAMTLNNIQTGLPGVFQAMTSFSALITESLETVCTRSYAI